VGYDIHLHVGSIGTNLAGLANVPQESNIERNHPIKSQPQISSCVATSTPRNHRSIALLLCPPTRLTKVSPKTFFTARLCEENGEIYIKSRELSFFFFKTTQTQSHNVQFSRPRCSNSITCIHFLQGTVRSSGSAVPSKRKKMSRKAKGLLAYSPDSA
jgi:hypothetical protein